MTLTNFLGVDLIKKSFITDCEGPLTLNDNAFELAEKFIPDGGEFFKKISAFDDYLIEEIKKENYNAGDTLKLLAPFFKAYNLANEDIIEFSKNNILLLNGATDTLKFAKDNLPSFIISTSYQQYIGALCDYIDFPYENTYKTSLDLDSFNITESEINILKDYKDEIIDNDFNRLYEIFFDEIPKMDIYPLLKSVKTVGGEGKLLAMKEIIEKHSFDPEGILYTGDSITDVEPLRFLKENNGVSISFNGNTFALREAEIAVISDNTIITSILLDLHKKDNLYDFIDKYSANPILAIDDFDIDESLKIKFKEVFKNESHMAVVEFIDNKNKDDLFKLSSNMRNKIRGQSIGNLG